MPGPPVACWISARDPGLAAVKRGVRAAVVMPAAFGLTRLAGAGPELGLFTAFGSFSLLLLVEFPGRPRTRLFSYLLLVAVGSGLVVLGTLVSTHPVAAVATMAVVGFTVLLAGVASPRAAAASTATLLTFVLPVAVAGPVGSIGPRLLGWAIAAVCAVPACMLVWPSRWHADLRCRLAATIAVVAREARALAEGRDDPSAATELEAAGRRLRDQFDATASPPVGTAATSLALAKLVGRVEWVVGCTRAAERARPDPTPAADPIPALVPVRAPGRAVLAAVADTLDGCALLVADAGGRPVDDPDLAGSVRGAARRLDGLVADRPGPAGADPALERVLADRAVGIAAALVADATLEAAGLRAVEDGRLGPPGDAVTRSVLVRLTSHLTLRSVWCRNAVRGAAGLTAAVAVAEVTNVEHGFWVVLGALSVLRSNALGTGSTAARAVAGTVVGFVVGAAVMVGVGDHTTWLWALFPLAVLVAGVAPSTVSYAAGQAGFTVMVIILFNILSPVGWRVGLTRVEDVALGCGVGVVAGLLLWPRGATAALGRALADAFVTGARFLADAVECLTGSPGHADAVPAQRAAYRSHLRLDDAYRQYLAEPGAKVVPAGAVTRLLAGAGSLRMAAFTVVTQPLPEADSSRVDDRSVTAAASVLCASAEADRRWYEALAAVLAGQGAAVPAVPAAAGAAGPALRSALEDVRAHHRGDRARTVVQLLWVDGLLEERRRDQAVLAEAAGRFARSGRRRRASHQPAARAAPQSASTGASPNRT